MVTLSFEMVIFILNISIVNLFKQSNEVALFLPFSATYGVGGAPGRTANIHFQFRRFENAVIIIKSRTGLEKHKKLKVRTIQFLLWTKKYSFFIHMSIVQRYKAML